MKLAALEPLERQVDAREIVAEEMAAALERLACDMAHAGAALTLRQAIGYLAGVYARSFGHAAAIKALITIARRGFSHANEELTAARH